jgi:hypothetical protein
MITEAVPNETAPAPAPKGRRRRPVGERVWVVRPAKPASVS